MGRNFEMSPILTPLAPYRDRMVVVSGLAHNQAETVGRWASGDHTRGTSSWLTGVHPKRTEGADVRNGISADQVAAAVLGKDTALPSLELAIDLNFLAGQCENSYSCVYLNTLAWTSPTTPLPTENNPRVVFERLFGDGGTPASAPRRPAHNRSMLDSVLDDFLGCSAARTVGPRADGRVRRRRARGRAPHPGAPSERRRRAADPRPAPRHSGALRRARQADVRAAVAGVPRRSHPGRDLHARARAELPDLSRDWRHRGPSRAVAPRRIDPEQIAKYAKVGVYQAELFVVPRASSRPHPRAMARCSITRCSSTAPA